MYMGLLFGNNEIIFYNCDNFYPRSVLTEIYIYCKITTPISICTRPFSLKTNYVYIECNFFGMEF